TAVVNRFNVEPTQIGLLLVGDGVAGVGLITTLTVPAVLVHVPTVIVTEYVPASARVTFGIEGFCKAEMNPLGPVQLYVPPTTKGVNRFNVEPSHTGLLLVGVGVAGGGLTITFTVPTALVQVPTVTVNE